VKRPVFFFLNIIFIFLVISQARLASIFILMLWILGHYLSLQLMLCVGARAKKLVFICWLVLDLVFFALAKEYGWITKYFLWGHRFPVWWSVLGYSFILFRQVHLSVNVRDGMVKTIRPLDYLNYNLAFWTFLAGPIQRYDDFIGQFQLSQTVEVNNTERLKGLNRMLWGLIKVVGIAPIFDQYTVITTFTTSPDVGHFVVFLLSFPLYLYLNFSGYCDVVIGFARGVGFKVPENFRRPFAARNMIDFWGRWHMTLSEFFRDYLYFPMLTCASGRFNPLVSSVGTTLISFFLMGIWHGSSVRFAVFGMLHGAGVSVSFLYGEFLKAVLPKERLKAYKNNSTIKAVAIAACQSYVVFTFLIFKYPLHDLRQVAAVLLKGHLL
jgi:D-alanyl-lipoteichoic acid acyltransferase DltB (MBOAT superfamily)